MTSLPESAQAVLGSGALAHLVTTNLNGTAQISCVQQLAYVYVGPDVVFPPMVDPSPGYVMHIAVERVGGFGPWAS